jgi:hypothetical protein
VTFTGYLPGLLVNLDKSVELQREDEDGETCSTSTSETNETNASRETRFRVKHLEWLASDPVLHNQWKQNNSRARALVSWSVVRFFVRISRRLVY